MSAHIASVLSIPCGYAVSESLSNRDVGTCILSISDLHIPFQKPIETFSEYAGKIDILQVNGDCVDAAALSRFSRVYRQSPMEEICWQDSI
ncbi:MAG: hypothetical protein ACLRWM_00225 [Streptococcus sp.]